jgi:hypothetical protein
MRAVERAPDLVDLARKDEALPTLAAALSPAEVEAAFEGRIPALSGGGRQSRLQSIEVVAYKPNRRCLIEYTFEVGHPDGSVEIARVLGKVRANRFGNSGYRLLHDLWDAGFNDHASDGIAVPEPVGTVPALRMWVQRRVDGAVATRILPTAEGPDLAKRIAAAIQKIHITTVAPDRTHQMSDELAILERCLRQVAERYPTTENRVRRLIDRCERLGAMLPEPIACPSHRDFYADQVIVSGTRLVAIDFDLFCFADPGLDLGNFLGHVTEQAVRECGDAAALVDVEAGLEDAFVAKATEGVRYAVRVYAALTLARHVYLSSVRSGRTVFVPLLLSLAEARVDRVLAEGGHA